MTELRNRVAHHERLLAAALGVRYRDVSTLAGRRPGELVPMSWENARPAELAATGEDEQQRLDEVVDDVGDAHARFFGGVSASAEAFRVLSGLHPLVVDAR